MLLRRYRVASLLAHHRQHRLPLRHAELVGLHLARKAGGRSGLGAFTQGELAQDPVGFLALVEHRPVIMDEEGDLETPDFLPERLELFGRPRLSFEGRQLAPDLMNNVADSQQILVGGLQLSQRLGLLSLVADDPSCLFDQLAPLDRRCLQHTINPALLDDRMSFTASARVEQQAANVFQAAGRLIDEVLAHAVAEQSARHHHFVTFPERKWQSRRLAAAVAVVVWSSINIAEDEGDFGHAQRLTGLGPVEDDVLHPFAAQGLGALLAQDPEDRIEDVALANPARPDDGRDPGVEAHLSLHEGLKPSHLQPHQIHRLPALPRGAVHRIRPWRKATTISCREMQIKTQPDGAAMSRYRTGCRAASVLDTTNRDGPPLSTRLARARRMAGRRCGSDPAGRGECPAISRMADSGSEDQPPDQFHGFAH